jgi:hypothetical protein
MPALGYDARTARRRARAWRAVLGPRRRARRPPGLLASGVAGWLSDARGSATPSWRSSDARGAARRSSAACGRIWPGRGAARPRWRVARRRDAAARGVARSRPGRATLAPGTARWAAPRAATRPHPGPVATRCERPCAISAGAGRLAAARARIGAAHDPGGDFAPVRLRAFRARVARRGEPPRARRHGSRRRAPRADAELAVGPTPSARGHEPRRNRYVACI